MANEFIARNGIISRGNLLVTGSLTTSGSLTATGTITATTLVVQTITSSVSSITGSTKWGSIDSNTHQFTGSIYISGSSVLVGTTTSNGFKFKLSNNGAEEIAINPGDSANLNNYVNYNRNTSTYIAANYLAATHSFLNGNVGIGTSSPSQKLSISYSDGGAQTTIYNTSTGHSVFANNTADKDINYQVLGLGSHYFSTAGTSRLQIRDDGLILYAGTNTVTYKNAYFANTSTDFVISGTEGAGTTKNVSIQSGGSASAGRIYLNSLGFAKMSNDNSYYQQASPAHELRSGTGGEWNTIMTSTASNPYGLLIGLTPNISGGGNEFIAAYVNNIGTLRFKVASNGGIYNYSANNSNLSDIRLKKDISPLESYWNKFKTIEIVKFKYIDQSHDDYNIGVIAQQVEEVAPEFIDADGWDSKNTPEDGIPIKSVYESDLHHATIRVLQEAMAKIEQLEAKVIELENK